MVQNRELIQAHLSAVRPRQLRSRSTNVITEAELADACRLLGDAGRLRAVAALLDGEQAIETLDPVALRELVGAGAARVEGGRARLTEVTAQLCGRLVRVALRAATSNRSHHQPEPVRSTGSVLESRSDNREHRFTC